MGRTRNTPDLSARARQEIVLFLAERATDGRLKHGSIAAAVAKFGHCRQTVSSAWRHRLDDRSDGPRRGRPPVDGSNARVAERVAQVAAVQRGGDQTLRELAEASSVSKSTLLRYMRRGLVPATSGFGSQRRRAPAVRHKQPSAQRTIVSGGDADSESMRAAAAQHGGGVSQEQPRRTGCFEQGPSGTAAS